MYNYFIRGPCPMCNDRKGLGANPVPIKKEVFFNCQLFNSVFKAFNNRYKDRRKAVQNILFSLAIKILFQKIAKSIRKWG